MRVLIILISTMILWFCSTKNVVFKNELFKKELDNFITEGKNEGNVLHLTIADESDIFEEVIDKNKEHIFLTFYYYPPKSCVGFYKSFQYKEKLIILYNFSEKIRFSDLLNIEKEAIKCTDNLLFKGFMDIPLKRRYYFKSLDKLVEIKEDGSLRTVE
ncbi:hypothetical protein NU10_00670 [Flavobacterium dauae]|uniref:hypothetical protein n=1 Tax=Flavobacterium dauae TaxID=1563479 RepID=UPI00101DD048|nr:hypothetical protein [Flavobacterium dauae]WLD23936.1 hypothetical protein NU10_00670 [Flavobacterium dauae]